MTLLYLNGAGELVYYGIHHNPDVPANSGQVMPFFVAHKMNTILPGLAGLFIAALFAATMSSVDSGINSISAEESEAFPALPFQASSQEILGSSDTICLTMVKSIRWRTAGITLAAEPTGKGTSWCSTG